MEGTYNRNGVQGSRDGVSNDSVLTELLEGLAEDFSEFLAMALGFDFVTFGDECGSPFFEKYAVERILQGRTEEEHPRDSVDNE